MQSKRAFPDQPAAVRRDRAIEADVLEIVSTNNGLRHLTDLSLWVDGGVAHLRGSVGDESELRRLRRAVGLVRGIHAVWDIVERAGRQPPVAIDLGCGDYKQVETAIGVDRSSRRAVNAIADLEKGLPFRDESIDHVFAVHVLEHLRDLIHLMNEVHRVLRPDGVLHVLVPYWQHPVAVADPTHVRLFVPDSFKIFCERRDGIKPYRPLLISHNEDTVFADLAPDKEGAGASDEEIVRFFL